MATCPACKTDINSIWGMRNDQNIYQCSKCELTYFDRDAIVEVPNDYQGYHLYLSGFDSNRYDYEFSIRKNNFNKELGEISKYTDGRVLVDIGADVGYFCKQAFDSGWNSTGIELSDDARTVGKEFLSVEYSELDDIANESVDVITCHHVIEHVVSPAEFVRALRSKLKKGGVMVIHVPNQESLTSLLRNILNKLLFLDRETYCSLYMPDHLSGFNRVSLAKFMENNNFETMVVKDVGLWSCYYDPFFLKNHISSGNYLGIIKKIIKGIIDHIGCVFGRGDWVVGIFQKK